jgi:hypothetical protein
VGVCAVYRFVMSNECRSVCGQVVLREYCELAYTVRLTRKNQPKCGKRRRLTGGETTSMIAADVKNQDDISLRIIFADFRNGDNAERYIILILTVSAVIVDVHLGAAV